jgi:hypothetical protein
MTAGHALVVGAAAVVAALTAAELQGTAVLRRP